MNYDTNSLPLEAEEKASREMDMKLVCYKLRESLSGQIDDLAAQVLGIWLWFVEQPAVTSW